MKILRSTPFVLLYISVAILVAGCVLLGSRAMLKPFNAIPLAVTLMAVGGALTAAYGVSAWMFVMEKIDKGEVDDDGD